MSWALILLAATYKPVDVMREELRKEISLMNADMVAAEITRVEKYLVQLESSLPRAAHTPGKPVKPPKPFVDPGTDRCFCAVDRRVLNGM